MRDNQRKAMFARMKYVNAPSFSANNLPVQVSTIVPSTTAKSRFVGEKKFLRRVDGEKKWFSDQFGGDTSVKTVGSYAMGNKLIKEKGSKVTSSTTTQKYNKMLPKIEKHIEDRRKEWQQDTMLLEVEGQTYITPKKDYIDNEKSRTKKILVS